METRYLPIFSPEIKTAWAKIEKDAPGLNPFMYYGFQSHLAESLRPWTAIGLHSVKAICVYDHGRIMGILPFVRRNTDGKMRLLGDIKGCGINDMVIPPIHPNGRNTPIWRVINSFPYQKPVKGSSGAYPLRAR